MTIETIERNKISNRMTLRNNLVTAKNITDKPWLLETPKVIRQQAVFKAVSNYKTCMTNLKNGNCKHFTFKKRKTDLWTMGIEKQIVLNSTGELTMFKGGKFNFGSFRSRDKLLKKMKINSPKFSFVKQKNGMYKPGMDCNIHKDRYGRYYLMVPYVVNKKKSVKKNPRTVSLDPGLRKFLSAYSPDGECSFLGVNCRDRLWELLQRLDKLDFLINQEGVKGKRKKTLRKRKVAIYRKLSDLKNELHNKIINYLTERYTIIVLGKLDVSDIVRKEKRVLRTKEVRSILSLSHYEFRLKLTQKCKSKGINLMVVNEAWTSKTCTGCGTINRSLGASKVYKCPMCLLKLDRDLNGARNILIRTMGKLTTQSESLKTMKAQTQESTLDSKNTK